MRFAATSTGSWEPHGSRASSNEFLPTQRTRSVQVAGRPFDSIHVPVPKGTSFRVSNPRIFFERGITRSRSSSSIPVPFRFDCWMGRECLARPSKNPFEGTSGQLSSLRCWLKAQDYGTLSIAPNSDASTHEESSLDPFAGSAPNSPNEDCGTPETPNMNETTNARSPEPACTAGDSPEHACFLTGAT